MFTICNTHCFHYKHPEFSAVYKINQDKRMFSYPMGFKMFPRPNPNGKWLIFPESTFKIFII